MRNVKTIEDVQVALRELYGQLDRLNSKDIDMRKRRVVNASPSKDPYDYVVRKELVDKLGDTAVDRTGEGSSGGNGGGVYTLVFCNNGSPKVGNPSAPYYVIKRQSILTCINIIAEVAPNTGTQAEFKIYKDGSLVNGEALIVPDTYTPGTILTFTTFLITSFEPESVVSLEAVSVNHLSNVTIEMYYTE